MMLWLLANHNYSQAKKRKFFEKQFTAKVNTRRDKAITEKKGFTNLVRSDLKMSDWKVWQFCYWLARGIHFFNVQRLCYRNCSPFFQECKGTPILHITQPDGTLFFLIFTYLRGRSSWNSRDYPQMWQYVIFLTLKPTKVTSDFILN